MPVLSGPDGVTTHALVGFINLLTNPFKQIPFLPADHKTICFWDSPGKGKGSKDETPEWLQYKGTRTKQPDDLFVQMGLAYRASELLGFGNAKEPGVEADALLGSFCLSILRREPEAKILILSSDKDMMQLVGPQVSVISMNGNPFTEVGTEGVIKRWGVNPLQIPDMLAMMGDKSDNIPGIPGIGEKAAQECLRTYKSIDDAMFHIIRANQLGEKIPRYAKLLIEFADRIPILMQLIKFSEIPVPLTQSEPKFKELKTILTGLKCIRTLANVDAYQLRLRGGAPILKRHKPPQEVEQ